MGSPLQHLYTRVHSAANLVAAEYLTQIFCHRNHGRGKRFGDWTRGVAEVDAAVELLAWKKGLILASKHPPLVTQSSNSLPKSTSLNLRASLGWNTATLARTRNLAAAESLSSRT